MLQKKYVIIFAASMLIMSSSNSFAAFADQHLIRVIYDRSGNEYATDMGTIDSLMFSFSYDKFNINLANFRNLNVTSSFVVYFALDRATNELWATGSTTKPTIITGGSLGLTGMKYGSTSMYNWYNGNSDGTNYTGLASATNSYRSKLSSTQGTMAAAITNGSRLNTEASLATIATAPITQTLYYWANGLATTTAGKTGTAVATITTTATPIPAAAWLFGSGLLGLAGLRRKRNIAFMERV